MNDKPDIPISPELAKILTTPEQTDGDVNDAAMLVGGVLGFNIHDLVDDCICKQRIKETFDRVEPGSFKTEEPKREAAKSTCDALLYELRTYGIAQLKNAHCLQRLSELSADQLKELIAALRRLQTKYPTITDQLIGTLGGQHGQPNG